MNARTTVQFATRLYWMPIALVGPLVVGNVASAQISTCPRQALTRLANLAGDWNVEWRWGWGVDADSTMVQDATARIELSARGCAVVEQLHGTLRGRPLAVTAMIAAPTDDSLQRAYVDSEHGGILLMNGEVRGDTLTFRWGRDLGTRRLLVRAQYFHITPDLFEARTLTSPNSGATWVEVQRVRYHRRR